MEVPAGVAAATGRIGPVPFGLKAPQGCPRLDQGAVARGVLSVQELPHPRVVQDRPSRTCGDFAGEHPVAVGRGGGRMPDRIVHPGPDEPPAQEVARIERLHQQPLQAYRLERLQQPLGRDRRPAPGGRRVVRELDAVITQRGRPATVVSDNGTELTARPSWMDPTASCGTTSRPASQPRTPSWRASSAGSATSA
jgi:hypothetical protein